MIIRVLQSATEFDSFGYSFKKSLWSPRCVPDSVLIARNRDEIYSLLISSSHSIKRTWKNGKTSLLGTRIETHDKAWRKEGLQCGGGQVHNLWKPHLCKYHAAGAPWNRVPGRARPDISKGESRHLLLALYMPSSFVSRVPFAWLLDFPF